MKKEITKSSYMATAKSFGIASDKLLGHKTDTLLMCDPFLGIKPFLKLSVVRKGFVKRTYSSVYTIGL